MATVTVDQIRSTAYALNRVTFNEAHRAKAREILNLYGSVFTGKEGIRQIFDCRPDNVHEMEERLKQHPSMLKLLKAQADQLAKLIELLEEFTEYSVYQLDPKWRPRYGNPRMIDRPLTSQTVPICRSFYGTVIAYLDELNKEHPDQAEIKKRARHIAYVINPEAWRGTVAGVRGHNILKLGKQLQRYFRAMLFVPKGIPRQPSSTP